LQSIKTVEGKVSCQSLLGKDLRIQVLLVPSEDDERKKEEPIEFEVFDNY
jgi:hypothetical protein